MIIGLTHNNDGSARVRRNVTCKLAIGLPPDAKHNYPRKLDHIVFLKKKLGKVIGNDKKEHTEIIWEIDQELMKFYGENCTSVPIVVVDDDPELVFKTKMAAFASNRAWCIGDGVEAERRVQIDKEWPPKGPFQRYPGPCSTGGCKFAGKECKPSGDLYFFLFNFPELGTIGRIHTSSGQSIMQINSALQDVHSMLGRLQGAKFDLYMAPDKATFEQQGKMMTSTKWVWGLRLQGATLKGMLSEMSQGTRLITDLARQIAPPKVEVEVDEPDDERGDITDEFYSEEKGPSDAHPADTRRAEPLRGEPANENAGPSSQSETTGQRIIDLGNGGGHRAMFNVEFNRIVYFHGEGCTECQLVVCKCEKCDELLELVDGKLLHWEHKSYNHKPVPVSAVPPAEKTQVADETRTFKPEETAGFVKGQPGAESKLLENVLLLDVIVKTIKSGKYQVLLLKEPSGGTVTIQNWDHKLHPVIAIAQKAKVGCSLLFSEKGGQQLSLDDITLIDGVRFKDGNVWDEDLEKAIAQFNLNQEEKTDDAKPDQPGTNRADVGKEDRTDAKATGKA